MTGGHERVLGGVGGRQLLRHKRLAEKMQKKAGVERCMIKSRGFVIIS